MSERVIVNDVGPRDGLQNQRKILTPAERLQLVESLVAAGMKHIEVGSEEIIAGLPAVPGACFTVLIPNMKGYALARAAGARSVTMVLYGSDGMARKNVKMGKQKAEEVSAEILQCARKDGIRVSTAIAVAFECPFDGPTDPEEVQRIADQFLQLGADEISIADTIGAADPGQVRTLTANLVRDHGSERLCCHFHDTRALGLANVFAALESGIRKFDASIGGLGGCPFAPGASGNVATEDVVMMLQQMGFDTGIDLHALLEAAALAQKLTGTAPGGRALPWLRRRYDGAATK